MKRSIISVTLDQAIDIMQYDAGHTLTYTDGIPTIDDGLAFFISQLTGLEAKIYESKYTAINFEELIPTAQGIPEFADTWTYLSYDAVTLGKFIGSSADDLPSVSAQATKTVVEIGYAGNSYDYSLDELRKSQELRMPLDNIKAKAAFRGSQEHTQRVAYFGDSERNMTGLFNNPNLALDNSNVDWDTATGQEISDDMNSLLIKVWIDSANVHLPNVLVLDSQRYATITSRRMDSGTDTTIAEFFMKNNLFTTTTGQAIRIAPRLQLIGAGVASVDRMLAYELNDENLAQARPIPWRSLAPQTKGLNIIIPAEYKMGGTEFRYTFSGAYRDHM